MKVDRIKVCMVGPSRNAQGGISSVLRTYGQWFDRIDLVFLSTYSGKNRGLDLLMFLSAILRLMLQILTDRCDIYHIHMASKGSFLRKSILGAICHSFRKTYVYHVHGAQFDEYIEHASERRKKAILRTLRFASCIIVLSESWKRILLNYIPEGRIFVVYNPVHMETDISGRSGAGFGAQLGEEERLFPCRFLFMGRMGERKGVYDLIPAAAALEIPFDLFLYGDGEVAQVNRLIAEKGLEQHIHVSGWVAHDQVGPLYDRADILVLPSYAEGLPMSVLEGLSHGLPVIATRVGGIPEAVEQTVNGLLVEPGDVRALSRAMAELAGNPEARIRMGRSSLEICRKRFSTTQVQERLLQVYSGLEYARQAGARGCRRGGCRCGRFCSSLMSCLRIVVAPA